jgi:hypothetical protein
MDCDAFTSNATIFSAPVLGSKPGLPTEPNVVDHQQAVQPGAVHDGVYPKVADGLTGGVDVYWTELVQVRGD